MSDNEYYICDKCNGEGSIYEDFSEGDPLWEPEYQLGTICPKCNGHRKLDWIENIVGKQPTQFSEEDFFKQEYPNKFEDINVGKRRK